MAEIHVPRRLHDEAVATQEAGDYMRLLSIAGEMAADAESSGNHEEAAWAQYFTGAASFQRNDARTARRAYREAQERFDQIGHREGSARATLGLAAVALDIDLNPAEARHAYDRCLPVVRELGDRRWLAFVVGNLGEICRIEGKASDALRWSAEAVELFLEIGEPGLAGSELANTAHYYFLLRDYAAALASLHEGYALLTKDPIPRWVPWYFDLAFIIVAGLQHWDTAATILGFVNHYRDEHGAPRLQGLFPWFSAPVETVSSRFSHEELQALFHRGERMSADEAHALLEGVTPP